MIFDFRSSEKGTIGKLVGFILKKGYKENTISLRAERDSGTTGHMCIPDVRLSKDGKDIPLNLKPIPETYPDDGLFLHVENISLTDREFDILIEELKEMCKGNKVLY